MLTLFSFASFGWGEWLLIAFLILLLFGAKRLPELARSVGRSIRQFQHGVREIQEEIEKEPSPKEKPGDKKP